MFEREERERESRKQKAVEGTKSVKYWKKKIENSMRYAHRNNEIRNPPPHTDTHKHKEP